MRCCCAAPRVRSWPYAGTRPCRHWVRWTWRSPCSTGRSVKDGTIQGLFEMMGTRYVGAGVLASAVIMDKHFTKLILAAHGLPVGPFVAITAAEWARDRAACLEAVAVLRYPLFVKRREARVQPRHQQGRRPRHIGAGDRPGSRARSQDHRRSRASSAPASWSAGCWPIWTGGPPQASQVAEIRPHSESGFYDFDAKYLPEEQVDLDVPADVDRDLAEQVRALAVRTFEAIGCEGWPGSTLRHP